MKKLIVLFLFVAQIAFAQEVPKEYQKMNTMQVELESDDPLTSIAKRLMEQNYDIEIMDKELKYLRTVPKAVASVQWQIRVKVNGNKVEFQNYTSMDALIMGVSSAGWNLTNFKSPPGAYGKIADGLYAFVSGLGQEITYFQK